MSFLRHSAAIALLLATCAVRPQAAPAELPTGLTLSAAKRLALAGNPGVESLLARVRAAEAVVQQARSALLPHAGASLGASWLYDVPLSRGDADNVPFYQAGIAAHWLLFDGFASRFRIEAAKAGSEASLAQWQDGRRLLAQGVATVFLNALLAADAGRVLERDAEFNRSLLLDADKRLAAGAGARADVLNFRVRVRSAENELLGSAREVRTARQALAALMGLSVGDLPEQTELVASAGPDPQPPASAEQAIEQAFTRRPDLLRYGHALDELEAITASRRSAFQPRLVALGNYSFERTGNPHFQRDHDASSALGLALTWDLVDGGQRMGAVAEAQAQRLALAGLRDQLPIDIASEIRQALDAVNTAAAQLANQNEISGMASEIRDIVSKEYLAGVSPLTRLNEAQTDLVRAEGRLSQMRIRYALAAEVLATALGENLPAP